MARSAKGMSSGVSDSDVAGGHSTAARLRLRRDRVQTGSMRCLFQERHMLVDVRQRRRSVLVLFPALQRSVQRVVRQFWFRRHRRVSKRIHASSTVCAVAHRGCTPQEKLMVQRSSVRAGRTVASGACGRAVRLLASAAPRSTACAHQNKRRYRTFVGSASAGRGSECCGRVRSRSLAPAPTTAGLRSWVPIDMYRFWYTRE